MKLLPLLSAACLAVTILTAQLPDAVPDWQTAAGGKRAFEVASVKPSKEFRLPNFPLNTGDGKPSGGRFSSTFPLVAYIAFAYKLLPDEISMQLPKSFPMDLFEIEAHAPGNPTKDQMRLMMQSLLADRFRLRVHFETHEGPVFSLTLVRSGQTGPKLHPHSEGAPCPDFELDLPKPFAPLPPRKEGDAFPPVCGFIEMMGTPESTLLAGRDVTMESIAKETIHNSGSMAGEVDKPVIDQTGLKGRFDFVLELPPRTLNVFAGALPGADNLSTDPKGTPFLNAVRTQLGLKIVSSKGPIRKLVIDHVEPLSQN